MRHEISMFDTKTALSDRYRLQVRPGRVEQIWRAITYYGKCNYQDKAKTVLTAEKKMVQITGTALFPGDICPGMAVISGGSAELFGVQRRIEQGTKARNPDGSVNYTEVLLV